MKRKKIKKTFLFLTLLIFLFSTFCNTCLAWENDFPVDFEGVNNTGYNLQQIGYYTNEFDIICAVFVEYRVPNGSGSFDFQYMYFVDSEAVALSLDTLGYSYGDNYTTIPNQIVDLWDLQGSSWNISVLYSEILDIVAQFNAIYESAPYDSFSEGYNRGYIDGLNESDIAKNTVLTLFSAPTYILSTVFGFEIFGINVYTIICFVLTLSIVSIILKKIL